MAIRIKRNDVGVVFSDTLTSNGTAVNLTGATVLFLLLSNTGTLISKTATIVTAASGTVSYTTVTGDLATTGNYRQEWQATLSGGAKLTFPSDGYNSVVILNDLDNA